MQDGNMEEYEQLIKEHEALKERYAMLEKWEEKLMNDTDMDEDEKVLALNKLAKGYEWTSNKMKKLTERALALKEKMEE